MLLHLEKHTSVTGSLNLKPSKRISVNGKGAAAQNTGTAQVPLRTEACVGPSQPQPSSDSSWSWQ